MALTTTHGAAQVTRDGRPVSPLLASSDEAYGWLRSGTAMAQVPPRPSALGGTLRRSISSGTTAALAPWRGGASTPTAAFSSPTMPTGRVAT
jgi:hypothetical protein